MPRTLIILRLPSKPDNYEGYHFRYRNFQLIPQDLDTIHDACSVESDSMSNTEKLEIYIHHIVFGKAGRLSDETTILLKELNELETSSLIDVVGSPDLDNEPPPH